eukprot:7580807-Prorocentrum_lima.AAC.1
MARRLLLQRNLPNMVRPRQDTSPSPGKAPQHSHHTMSHDLPVKGGPTTVPEAAPAPARQAPEAAPSLEVQGTP